MIRIFDWLTGRARPNDDDEIGEIRAALAQLVKFGLKKYGTGFTLKIWDCEVSGVPVGSWVFDVRHLAQAGEAGTAETPKIGSVYEHAVAKPCAQNKS